MSLQNRPPTETIPPDLRSSLQSRKQASSAREYSRLGRRSAADREAEAAIRRMRLALAMVALVIVSGTIGYMLISHMDFLSALFMTVTTITTVGYGEVKPLGPAGRWFSIVLILGGVGLSLYTLASAFEMLVSQQFQEWRQRKKMSTRIGNISRHFIICGYGRIGRQIADELTEAGESFVVIDADPARCSRLLERDIPYVEGDATLDDVLLEAGIERARGFVGALNSDADNVMTVVSARGLNPDLFIVARAALPEAESKLQRAGADEVISPYVVGAHRISLSLLRPGVASFLTALVYNKDIETEITEHTVTEDSPLAGQTLEGAGMAHGREVLRWRSCARAN